MKKQLIAENCVTSMDEGAANQQTILSHSANQQTAQSKNHAIW